MYIHVVQNNNIKEHFCPAYMFVFIYMTVCVQFAFPAELFIVNSLSHGET